MIVQVTIIFYIYEILNMFKCLYYYGIIPMLFKKFLKCPGGFRPQDTIVCDQLYNSPKNLDFNGDLSLRLSNVQFCPKIQNVM